MQLSQLFTLIIFALVSTQPAALLQRTAGAAPVLTPESAGTAAGAESDSNGDDNQQEDEVIGGTSSEVVPPPNNEEEEEEDLDLSERLTEAPVPVHYMLSVATGQFVAITKSGRVQANTQFGKSAYWLYNNMYVGSQSTPRLHACKISCYTTAHNLFHLRLAGRLVAQFTMLYEHIDGRQHVSIRSVKYENRGWFLTVTPNRRVKGSIPSDGNEVFEVVSVPNEPSVSLKLRQNPMSEGSGEDIAAEPCFIGFSVEDGRPSCYSSSSVETQLLFLDASV